MKISRINTETSLSVTEDLVILVDENSLNSKQAAMACDAINQARQRNYNTAMAFKKNSGNSQELRLIFMSMISNRFFSIMEVDDLGDVDEEYASSILEYTCDADELKAVLGTELGSFANQIINDPNNQVNNLVNSLINSTIQASQSSNTGLSEEEANNIRQSYNAEIAELKRQLDNERSRADTLSKSTVISSDKTSQMANKIESLNRCVDEQAATIKKQKADIQELTEQLTTTTEKLEGFTASQGGQVQNTTYIELNLDRFKGKLISSRARIDVEHVLYFKELTPCGYINSFIVNLVQYIKLHKKKNIICLIYDRAEFTRHKYGKLKLLEGGNFQAGHTLKDQNLVVVKDAAPQILEEALITYNFVIVYDRLGAEKDILSGRSVHKFIVCNSQKEMLEVRKETGLPVEQFITTFGTAKDSLSVRQVRDYKQMSQGGKIMSYANMASTKNTSDTIYERLFFTAGIKFDAISQLQ